MFMKSTVVVFHDGRLQVDKELKQMDYIDQITL